MPFLHGQQPAPVLARETKGNREVTWELQPRAKAGACGTGRGCSGAVGGLSLWPWQRRTLTCTLQLTASGCVSRGLCQNLAHAFPPNRGTGDAGGRGPRAGHAASPVSAAAVFLHPCLLHTSSPPKRSKAGSAHMLHRSRQPAGCSVETSKGRLVGKAWGRSREPHHCMPGKDWREWKSNSGI